MMSVKTIGLGEVVNPGVFAQMTFEQYKSAYELAGNYRNLPPDLRDNALKHDFALIATERVVDKVKTKGRKEPDSEKGV